MFEGQVPLAEPKQPQLADRYPATSAPLRGAFFKTRFYGQSHWMNFARKVSEDFPHVPRFLVIVSVSHSVKVSEVVAVIHAHEAHEYNHGCVTVARCKAIGRVIKKQESTAAQPFGSPKDMVPTRPVADRLVPAYLRTFQSGFGILYVPSFFKDYEAFWNDPGSVSEAFSITLLLVMCIGSTFCSQDTRVSRATALQWIFVASEWLRSPKEKARLNLDGLRIYCLFLLARQTRSASGDITWFSTGSLLRMAMHMGLHIDLENHSFSHMSSAEIESRRRLWATILELEIQSGMDCGGLPSIDSADYNCALPSNIDDESLVADGSARNSVTPKPMEQFTQSSIQILLMKMIPIRLRIVKFINSFQSENSFEKTLSLSAELSAALKSCSALIKDYCKSSSQPTTFQTKFFNLLVQRFLLGLHHPFAVEAMSNPSYYYSRKVCLETSSFLFSPSHQSRDDDFHRLQLYGTGLFRDVYTQSALYMCDELTEQLEADGPFTANPGSTFLRKEMHKAIEMYLELAVARIDAGEKNVKCYIFVSCLLAQADAMQAGDPVSQNISVALKKSLETCCSLLRSQIQGLPEIQDMPFNVTTIDEQLDWSQWDDLISLNENKRAWELPHKTN